MQWFVRRIRLPWVQRQIFAGTAAPADVQLTGVGNNPLLHFLFPQTLSVDPGYKQAGRLAAEQLLLQLEQQVGLCAQIAPAHPI